MRQKLNALQGLRFIGFLLIFMNHAYWILSKEKYFDYGARGVELFFVLSGFLIAYNYRDANIAYDFKSSISYMMGKLKKFYGLHILMFSIMAVKLLGHFYKHGMDYNGGIFGFIRDAFLNVTLLQSWYDPSKFSFNGVSWFLSCIGFSDWVYRISCFEENKMAGKSCVYFFFASRHVVHILRMLLPV